MRSLIVIFLLTLCAAATAQVKIVNRDVSDSDRGVLFLDFPNHVAIEGIEDMSQISLAAENGMVTRVGSDQYLVKNTGSATVTLNVLDFSSGAGKKILTRKFKLESLGDTVVRFIPEADTIYSNTRLNRTRLQVSFTNPNFNGHYEVAHFELTAKDGQGKSSFTKRFVSGPFLGNDICDRLKALKGGLLTFEQVILKGKDTNYAMYKAFSIKL